MTRAVFVALATPGVWFMRCRWPVAARLWFRGLIAMTGCYADWLLFWRWLASQR